jgi:ABC-type oligopeptide transport system substrate-binding subunit
MRVLWHFILAFFFLLPSAAHAEHSHALAMHGEALYPADFKHLDYVNPDAPKGGDMKTSKSGSFDNLNNHVILGNNAEGLELLNDKLMQRAWNEPFTLYGLVAESIDIAPDRSWITFHLNKNAKFHDGHPMTTEDVLFSYEMFRKYGHPVRRRVYGLITEAKILSPYDIKFTFGGLRPRIAADPRHHAGAAQALLGEARYQQNHAGAAARQRALQNQVRRAGAEDRL